MANVVYYLSFDGFFAVVSSPMGFVFMHSLDEWLNGLTRFES